jgi:transcriptional regulator with XRE-family HTH domain
MKYIASNIKHLRSLKKWSQEQLADQLNITRARIGSYEEERCDPPIDVLIKISKLYHIAIDALIKADLRKYELESMMKVGENRILFPILVDANNHDMVEVVTVKASAGYLNGYSDPDYIESLPLMNLPFRIIGKHRAFPIQGDSMPPLKEGCFVVGKYTESIQDVKDGNTYVLITKDDGIVYKRLYKKGKVLELHSDNKFYQPYQIKPSDILEIWEFVCTLNISDKKSDELNIDSIIKMLNSMRVEIGK